ncbi:MAG TPA: DUF1833 family protein [Frateuria sp.]|uniref:DUF1833 family protein n=1 Tax=Frateuria sp. TaxID=2211372 RepID=UPI002D7E6C85|nr:DUF1833 family protein [Frateuria sp.]HET6805329.1 DUF1833 family protein [Frateuria sp.]
MNPVSIDAMRAMFAQETGEVFLVCLTITHPDIPTQRLVNNSEPVVRSAGTYNPCPMQLRLPDQREDQLPQVDIVVDNVDREVLRLLRTISGVPQVTMEVILASSPDTVEAGPFNFSLKNATYDVLVINATLGFEDDILNQQVPAMCYTPTNSPGLFL